MASGRRFELIRELGTGAFGTVYLAHMISSRDFRKRVAIKLLNAQWDASGDAGRRLRDEARLLGLLRHRSIVAVDDLVMLDGRWAVIMEHVPGSDLERILEMCWKSNESVPTPAALEIISAVASALDAAFNGTREGGEPMRVVHRDIKPSNIRITPDGDVKVLDFGIARADFQGREAKTEEIRYGSLGYMAPERVLGDPEGPEGDVYALGCVLVEMLRGKAFGRSALLPDQQSAQVNVAVDDITARLGPDCGPVIELLRQTLEYEIHKRPSPLEVAERARRLARTFSGDDLPEFARKAVAKVTTILGDVSREARGQLTESPASPRDNDTSTQSIMIEGSAFDRTAELARRSGPHTAPTEAPETDDEATAPAWRKPLLIAIGFMAVLVILLPVVLRRDPPPPEPPAGEPALTAEPSGSPDATATTTPAGPPAGVGTTPTAGGDAAATAGIAAVTGPATTSADGTATDATAASSAASTSTSTTGRKARAPSSGGSSSTPTPSSTTTSASGSSSSSSEASSTPESSGAAPLRAVKFTVSNATSVEARCGGVSNRGSTSALLRDVPPGTCTVNAEIEGARYTGKVAVSAPTGITCSLQGGALACQ